jgi:hypothetical protein
MSRTGIREAIVRTLQAVDQLLPYKFVCKALMYSYFPSVAQLYAYSVMRVDNI